MGIEITGIEEVQKEIEDLAERVAAALPDAIRKGATLIEDSAKDKAPVQTGALRDSIITDVQRKGSEIIVEVGPTVDYADDVEFGRLRKAAQPYLRPAVDETEQEVLDLIVQELNRELGL